MKPLVYPLESELRIKRGWFNHIPIWGLTVQSQIQSKTHRHIQQQMDRRGHVGLEAWQGVGVDMRLKEKVDAILLNSIGWKKGSTFHPDDPFHILAALRFGDLCEVEAMMDIEELIGQELPQTLVAKIESGLTYAEFLRVIQRDVAPSVG